MRCIVTGLLKNDPRPRQHISEPLGKAHPGHVTKTVDGQERKFCKGSPLWDKKPKVQLFYDTSRDWVRIYCPRATLGIFTPDEIEEYGPDFARDVTPASGLAARLAAAPQSENGHKEGHAEAELASLRDVPRAEAGQAADETKEPAPAAKPKTKAKRASEPAKAKAKAEPPRGTTASKVAYPSNVKEYLAFARAWIKSETPEGLVSRWADERSLRNKCNVTAEDRAPLEELMKRRLYE